VSEESGNTAKRAHRLMQIAKHYALDGLGEGNFDAIPYHPDVELRAPLCPGGVSAPLRGREALHAHWWQPLPQLVSGVELLDIYVNEPLTAVAVEFLCHIREPACTLRVMDRFVVDEQGLIRSQENYFDPRDVTDPGWASNDNQHEDAVHATGSDQGL